MTRDTRLDPLSQTDLTLAPGEPDLRGASVFDRDGDELGRVDGLYVDGAEQKIRFLAIKRGGILGIGATTRLVPVEAIEHRDVGTVRLAKNDKEIAGSPAFEPALVADQAYWEKVYGWYGYPAYWTMAPVPFAGVYPYAAGKAARSTATRPPRDHA
jgi:hypothetical protein